MSIAVSARTLWYVVVASSIEKPVVRAYARQHGRYKYSENLKTLFRRGRSVLTLLSPHDEPRRLAFGRAPAQLTRTVVGATARV